MFLTVQVNEFIVFNRDERCDLRSAIDHYTTWALRGSKKLKLYDDIKTKSTNIFKLNKRCWAVNLYTLIKYPFKFNSEKRISKNII